MKMIPVNSEYKLKSEYNVKLAQDFRNSFFIIPALTIIGFVFLFPLYRVISNSFFEAILGSTAPGAQKFVGFKNLYMSLRTAFFGIHLTSNKRRTT